jgi:2-keto-4-pentenoate hydratase
LEITVFNLSRPRESKLITVLEDSNDIRQLAESIEVTGARQSNVEIAVSDTFLIRAIKGKESCDVVLRGPEIVRWEDGSLATISRKLMKTLRDLVAKQGRVFPRFGTSRDAEH